ncbi:DUF6549 family protein [uncultured Flavobacterium sp.]|uniref:DUF6549 family protein n=1 Tax=uncultured Flavobacterium sp. TaxID=165435 RepID=UPI0030EE21F6|tara:strand:+ start:50800 stop:51468 length:669 start_codon:yes stop_codon:yes gene_type:complete
METKTQQRLLVSTLMIVILFLASYSFVQCHNEKIALDSISALTSEVETYKLKNGQNVTSQEIAVISEKDIQKMMNAQMKEMAAEFSKITAAQTVKIKASFPKSSIEFDKPISITEIDSTTNELKFKRNGAYFNEWYEFGYNVTQDSLSIEPFSTWTEIQRVDGFKRKWFLGKKTYHSDISFTNPYINIEEVQTYEVAVPKRFYETTLFQVGVGLVGGFLLAK